MKHTILVLCIPLLSTVTTLAQTDAALKEEQQKRKKENTYDMPLFQRPISISLGLGTTGIGIEGKLALHKKWNIRLGTSILPFSYAGNLLFKDFDAETKIKANLNKIQVLAEFKPFSSSFRIVGGIGYFYKGDMDITQKGDGTYKIGNTTITGEEIGELSFSADWKGIAPYLGIGLFKDMPKRKFNVNLDIGTYYLSKPKAELSGTKLLEGNSENNEQLNENLKGDRWLPVLQLNFNYKIH